MGITRIGVSDDGKEIVVGALGVRDTASTPLWGGQPG
jgi:hypothetical protein